ncbi:MAG: carbohydrate kinase family protein [Clostridiales bacterium]|jgi:sugar/nucleoside kinase (ribokinase family)|nr:carbohydrate kinase family protein [Clostridiales bacterium]
MTADIVGLGAALLDYLVNLPRIPSGEGGAAVNEIFCQGGGNVASAMAASARLGKRSGMMAKVGGDAIGNAIINDFQYNGVDTSHIIQCEGTSTLVVAVSEVELGTRKFLFKKGDIGPLTPEELDYSYIASAKILHIENAADPATIAAARYAKSHNVTVSIDAAGYYKELLDLAPLIDIFIASEFFYLEMFRGHEDDYEGNLKEIAKMGPGVVWVTQGARGCVGYSAGRFYKLSSFDVAVKDTTGAGDVFHGAYLAAVLEGLPPDECARYASAVSAVKCMYVGGRTGLPNRHILERFLSDGAVETDELDQRLSYYRNNFMK